MRDSVEKDAKAVDRRLENMKAAHKEIKRLSDVSYEDIKIIKEDISAPGPAIPKVGQKKEPPVMLNDEVSPDDEQKGEKLEEPEDDTIKRDPDEWTVRGRIIDETGVGIAGLTVSLYDKDFFKDDSLSIVTTNEDGSFVATYRTEDFRDTREKKPDLFLKVLDKNGAELYDSRKVEKGIRKEAGQDEDFG